MKHSRKWINVLLILGSIGLVFYLGSIKGDLNDAWKAMKSADTKWLLCAFISWCVYALFEALVVHVFLRFQKIPAPFSSTLIVSLVGMFYSNVTPGATGGQPMMVYSYKKRGLSAGYTSSALAVKFFCFQSSLLISTVVLWIIFRNFVSEYMFISRWFVYFGLLMNFLGVLLVVLLAINKNIVYKMISSLVRLGVKLHIVKDYEKTMSRMDSTLEDFNGSVDLLLHHPLHLLFLTLLSLFQVWGLMSIIYFVTRAMGVEGYSFMQLVTLQFLLYTGAYFTPLPGASGAQEGGFYLFFQNIFPQEKLFGGLLLWRFFNYYFPMILTLLFGVVLDSVLTMKGHIHQIPSEPMK